jgi:uncharacterized membrane protein
VNWRKLISYLRVWERSTSKSIDEWLSRKFLNRDFSEIVVYLSVICYALIFSYFTFQKYYSFSAYAWDLGIFDQSLWTTVHASKFFYSTVEQFLNPTGAFFGIHFSPILFLVMPFYSLHPSPLTLLVFQSFVLGLGAVPLYFFAKKVLNVRTTAVVFSLVYLFYPPLQGINWFDFHLQSFLPLLFFCTIYFLSEEKWFPYFGFLFLSLMVAENVPILILSIAVYGFWLFRKQFFDSIKERTMVDKRIVIPILTTVLALAWWFFALWIQQTYFPINSAYSQLYKAVDNWSVLGLQGDPVTLPLYVLLNIGKSINALSYDFYLKVLYVFLLFGPLLFLSFRSLITGITLAWLVPAFLSNYSPYYIIGTQYPAYIVAFIFIGAVYGIKKSASSLRFPSLSFHTKSLLLTGFLFAVFVSPLSPVMVAVNNNATSFADYYPPSITDHDKTLQAIVNLVPKNASILTQNNIFPHFSNRVNAYAYPVEVILNRAPPDAMDAYLDEIVKKSDFILVDSISDPSASTAIIAKADALGAYGTYANADGIYLLKKGFQGDPVFQVP